MSQPIALYLEDDISVAKLMEKLLRQNGFDVVTCTTAEQAQEKLLELLPHALVIDIELSGKMSGLDWLKSVRNSAFSGLPAVITTGSVSKTLIQEAGQLDIVEYILKRADIHVIGSKFAKLRKKVDECKTYRLEWSRLNAREVLMLATAQIVEATPETLAVESQVQHLSSMEDILYTSPYFKEFGVRKPQLQMIKSITLSGQHSHFPFRNEFSIQGWNDTEQAVFRRQFWRNRAG